MEDYSIFIDRSDVIITTGDLSNHHYEIVTPVYFQINDKGDNLRDLIASYGNELAEWRKEQGSKDSVSPLEIIGDVANILNGFSDRDLLSNRHALFDVAFYISMEELKKRAISLGCDAIIYMRQSLDLDTTGFNHFYMQMYGTAVKTDRLKEIVNDKKPKSFKNQIMEQVVLTDSDLTHLLLFLRSKSSASEIVKSWSEIKDNISKEIEPIVLTKLTSIRSYEQLYGASVAKKELDKMIKDIEEVLYITKT